MTAFASAAVVLSAASLSTVEVFRSIRKTDAKYIAQVAGTNIVFNGSSTDEVRAAAVEFLNGKPYDYDTCDFISVEPAPYFLDMLNDDQDDKADGRKVARVWMHRVHDNHVIRATESEIQDKLDHGYVMGKKVGGVAPREAKDPHADHGNKGKRWMMKDGESVRVPPELVPQYLAAGFVKGRGTLNVTV